MGDRRNLLGKSAVLVGLGSALISGTAVAVADTGDSNSRPADNASSAAAETNSTATTPQRSPRQGRGGPERAVTNDVQKPDSTPVAPDNPLPVPVVDDIPPTPTVVSAPVEAAAAVEPVMQAEPVAVVVIAPASEPQPQPQESVPVPSVVVASTEPVEVTAYVSPTPAPAASLLDVLTGFGAQPGGGALIATPALAAFTGQRQSAAPVSVVGTPLAAAAPPDPTAQLPTNGVTGVQVGHSKLEIPGAFIGKTVPADWYFPTQVDGSVKAQGVIWLQHGFAAESTFYSALAEELAKKTNSIVVAPTLSSIPSPFSGGWLNGQTTQEAAAAAFLDPNRAALVASAKEAGFTGDVDQLLGRFALAGHSAGGGFSSAVADDYLAAGSDAQDANLLGVVMFDGVSFGAMSGEFTQEVTGITAAGKPIYQVAAPAQFWNLFGVTTNQLLAARPNLFSGAVMVNGSHSDAVLGVNPLLDVVLQIVTPQVPDGNTAGTYTLSTGWINDMYAGATPQAPQYGLYAGANQQIIMGNAAAIALPTPTANQTFGLRTVLKSLSDFISGLTGLPPTPEVNTGSNGVATLVTPPRNNGVTGVKTGKATLTIPSGNGYDAPAEWYFPTQADGSVQPDGIIWLQHGFLAFGGWYSDMATQLAQETNSIVVTPSIFWFDPLFSGGGEPIAEMFVGARPALNISANAAGFQGVLPEKFILTGHSAGGRLATTVAGYTVDNGSAKDLLGVVMFDGVPRDEALATALGKLDTLSIPLYQIASPGLGVPTEQLALLHPDQFIGVMIDNGKHTDSVSGEPIADLGSDLVIGASPPGAKAAVRTFASGWINDFYAGLGATDPQPKFGIYGDPNNVVYQPNRPLVMGQAGATTLPAPPPVDLARYAGTWYEQGSVKLFLFNSLVNTKAVYTLQPDGTLKVENSGNYFGPNGPQSGATGTAVPVNSPTNTRLNVGFFFGQPSDREPGNYTILDYDPNYQWVIVSDPTRFSGWILTRDQEFRVKYPDEYQALVDRAKQLGVRLPIRPSEQFPVTVGV